MAQVKICGITTSDSLHAAIDAGAAMIGFVHVPSSPRYISPQAAAALCAQMPAHINAVSLLADADDAAVQAALTHVNPDFIQLHGQESLSRMAALRALRPIIRAVPVATADDVAAAQTLAPQVDMLLLDAKPPAGATRTGGHGKVFDWALLQGIDFAAPWMLSGGLTPQNVAEAIRLTRAPWVDVSSGVEDMPGRKNNHKITAFIQAAMA